MSVFPLVIVINDAVQYNWTNYIIESKCVSVIKIDERRKHVHLSANKKNIQISILIKNLRLKSRET